MPLTFATVVRYCTTCQAEGAFEQPECLDGHADCPEWVCVECGDALLIGFLPEVAPQPVRRVA
jgi:hypothetical protein